MQILFIIHLKILLSLLMYPVSYNLEKYTPSVFGEILLDLSFSYLIGIAFKPNIPATEAING
jgi:hypothetical protein